VCAVVVFRKKSGAPSPSSGFNMLQTKSKTRDQGLRSNVKDLATADFGQIGRWVFLAFVPSSLMLGVTTFMTTDIAAVPLLWVIPLALYLLSFILVFAGRQIVPHRWMVRSLPLAALALLLCLLIGAKTPIWAVMAVQLAAFFIAAMACHGELARLR